MIQFFALVGILALSFSAVFIRLAAVSPVTATVFRAAYAVPVLLVIWLAQRSRDHRTSRERLLAGLAGLFLAADLDLWHECIALVGVGLGTVLPNVQIVFVAIVAWFFYRERPTLVAVVVMLSVTAGVVLTSGLARSDAYGANPVLGTVLGVVGGVCYSAYLLIFRASNRSLAPTSGPLLDATIGVLLGGLLSIAFDPHFAWTPTWPAHGWLALLALTAQVIGWLLIASALPRLPAVETSVLLMAQPVFAFIWGWLFFAERLSTLQWTGSGIVLAGVVTLSMIRRP